MAALCITFPGLTPMNIPDMAYRDFRQLCAVVDARLADAEGVGHG